MSKGLFVSHHNHTSIGSTLDSINDVQELFEEAKLFGQPALSITDHGSMTALYDARKASIKTRC